MGRLFWKIFLWFLAALLLLSALLYSLTLFHLSQSSTQRGIVERVIEQRVEAVTTIIRYGGKSAFEEYLEHSGDPRPRIWLLDEQEQDILGRRIPRLILALTDDQKITRTVESHDGQVLKLITYAPSEAVQQKLGTRLAQVRQQLPGMQRLMVFIVFSILACAWLAWYLTKPVRVLSVGARALAEGQLDKAIAPQLGTRKDELVNLAHDFDAMAEALVARQQAFQQLLNDISHELRSPLTRIRLKFGLLERQQEKLSDLDARQISLELDRLEQLIDQVLTLARLDAKQHYDQTDFIDLPGLLGAICQNVQLEAASKLCRLDCVLTDNEIIIAANGELLRRAFENIIRNAISHSPEGSVVSVCCVLRRKRFMVRVLDEGDGVEEAALPEIFSPFVRLESSRPRGGYGLGLAIAQRAVLRHGGSIRAYNENGAGLAVEIELPIESDNGEVQPVSD